MFELQQLVSHFPEPNEVIAKISGDVGMSVSLLIGGIGLPSQIYRTHQTGEKLSPILASGVLLAYISWTIHGFFKPDVHLAIAQTPGVIFSTVMLVQSLMSKKK